MTYKTSYIASRLLPGDGLSGAKGKELTTRIGRFDLIDVLRGIAILLVVILHVRLRIPFHKTDLLANLPEQFYNAIFASGGEGVRIFFVVSGFIITMTSLRRYSDLKHINVSQFYVYRFARIAPCLIALVIILSALHFLGIKDYVINSKFSYAETVFAALAFHLNWLEGMNGYLPGNWDVLWSLSVEEVFYICFPIVCLMVRRTSLLSVVLITVIIVGPFYRLSLEGNYVWQSKAYLSCMDSIAIGCLFALISHAKKISQVITQSFLFLGSAAIVFVLLAKDDASYELLHSAYLFETILSFGVGLVLIASVRQQISKTLYVVFSPLMAYGRLSYEIYLTHMFVVYEGLKLYKKYDVSLNYSLIWLVGIILISGLLGYIVERFFSSPLNGWIRKRFSPNLKNQPNHGALSKVN